MTNVLEIDDKKLYSITEVVKLVSYSRDYITRLAREKKIIASYVGRQWFVDVTSLQSYMALISVEQKLRKQQLRSERKQELSLRQSTLKQKNSYARKAKTFGRQAVLTTVAVFMFGILGGVTAYDQISLLDISPTTIINVDLSGGQLPAQVSKRVVVQSGSSSDAQSTERLEQPAVLVSHIRPLAEHKQNGILLFPEATSTVGKLFSDQVIVEQLPDGTKVVSRIDGNGVKVGNNIPFVVIPVLSSENNI